MIIKITGGAGTGKTWLINQLKEKHPDWIITSTTWVSALLTDSQSYHSKLRLPINFEHKEYPLHFKVHKTIIIDEASMLSRKQLYALRNIYPNCDFILVGDWNQLKPIDGEEIRKEDVHYTFELTVNHRQTDNWLIMFLNNLFSYTITQEMVSFIESRTITREEAIANRWLTLYYHNGKEESSHHNGIIQHRRDISYDINKYSIGCLLMAHNIYHSEDGLACFKPKDAKWINNNIYKVVERHPNFLRLLDEKRNKYINIKYEHLNWFELAYACSIHKIQGTTIENSPVVINLDSLKYCDNSSDDVIRLLYVALSRVKDKNQLYFIGKLPYINCYIKSPVLADFKADNQYILDEDSIENILNNENLIMKSIIETSKLINSSFFNQSPSKTALTQKRVPILYTLYRGAKIGTLLKVSDHSLRKYVKNHPESTVESILQHYRPDLFCITPNYVFEPKNDEPTTIDEIKSLEEKLAISEAKNTELEKKLYYKAEMEKIREYENMSIKKLQSIIHSNSNNNYAISALYSNMKFMKENNIDLDSVEETELI